MGLTAIGGILQQVGSGPTWERYRQWQRLLRLWAEVVGPTVQRQTEPLYIRQGVLYVATQSPVWAQQLSFERQRLLQRLNAHWSEPLRDIRFRPLLRPQERLRGGTYTPPQTATPAYRRLLVCPRCHAPAPGVELDRWGICSLCRAAELAAQALN